MKAYITFDPDSGYPAGADIFYECLGCGETYPSMSTDSYRCSCGRLALDVDYGRLSVKDHRLFRAFEE